MDSNILNSKTKIYT